MTEYLTKAQSRRRWEEEMNVMRAAAVVKPDGNRRRTAKRPVTKLVTTRSTGSARALQDYKDRTYRRRWARVWKGFWWGYGAVTVIALIQVIAGMT